MSKPPNHSIPLQVLAPGRGHPLPEDGAADFHVDAVEGAHDGLDPVLVDLEHEALDGLLGLRARGVGGDGGRCAAAAAATTDATASKAAGRAHAARGRPVAWDPAAAATGRQRLVQQEELDVGSRHEAGHVIVEELVDAFQVPVFVVVFFRLRVVRWHGQTDGRTDDEHW